jgi:hypothetical protein
MSAAVGVLAITVLAGVGLFYSGMIVMVEPRRTTASTESAPPAAPQPPLPQPPGGAASAAGARLAEQSGRWRPPRHCRRAARRDRVATQ